MAVFGKKSETVKTTPTTSNSPGSRNIPEARGSLSVVGRTLSIKGELFSDEEVFVEGKIEGKLNVKNKVIVGKTGEVNAEIEAHEVVIKGTVNGNVKGRYKVEIIPEGVLNGNIVSQRVVLAEGAIFKGNIDMTLREGNADSAPKIG
ncbi:MAG: polymer-forming cytoskeletal protein [bacterium]|nr:polymer-forming cytoskeletal protein [bacterium]